MIFNKFCHVILVIMEASETSCKVFYLMRVWSRHLAGISLVICSFIPQRGDLKPRASVLDFSAASPGGLVNMHMAGPTPRPSDSEGLG